MKLSISEAVRQKLAIKHGGITEVDIVECFANREAGFLADKRADHQTNPPSQWFIAETNSGRKLKVVFMYHSDTKNIVIKTAYDANAEEIRIYKKYA